MLRPFAQTRVLIDYDSFESKLGEGVIICTNQGVLNALRVLIRSYGLRNVNWVTAYSDAGYTGVTDVQFDTIDAEISAFLGETNDMSFCSELVTALQDIANSLGAEGCECGSAGSGGTTDVPSTNQPGTPGNPQPGDEVPAGFADFAEYNTYKCDVAEWLVQQVESDLGWWQSANFVTLAADIFIAGLLTPVPGDEVVALLGLLVSLALQGVEITGVGNMIDAVANNREDFVCALYKAGNASGSTSNLTAVIDSAIDGETAAIYAPLLKSILGQMFNASNVNRLYVRWDEKTGSLPTGDCDDCVCSPDTEIGTETSPNNYDTAFHAPATDPPGKNVIQVAFKTGASLCEVDQLTIVPTNINPTFNPLDNHGYKLQDGAGMTIYNSDTPPPVTDGVGRVIIQSNTAGSAVITWIS